jgi:uroporphyrinogen III methyltransferase/synthase
MTKRGTGTVYLVGAGPGDPGLLTIRAAEVLSRADVVVTDALVHPAIVDRYAPRAERIDVGKRGGRPSPRQEDINQLLVDLAQRYRVVVRLKGGDPFVFGRGGEEAEALAKAGVPFEVVPGITAGVAAPAYAGIPVTHRELASWVVLATGHEDPHRENVRTGWATYAPGATVVVYMGMMRLRANVAQLERGGWPTDTPAAVVAWGTWPRQRTVVAPLGQIAEAVMAAGLSAPALLVVGDVVRLRDRLAWFERRPLFGQRVVVTRARAQASALRARLEELGAEAIEFPTIRIGPSPEPERVRHAVARLGTYDWVVFTSGNGVSEVWRYLEAEGRDARAFGEVRIAAIGPATAAALAEHGLRADCVPERYDSEAVATALEARDTLAGRRVLLLRAREGRAILPERLRRAGAHVDDVSVYVIEPDATGAEDLRRELEAGAVDWVLFTASSTVRNFVSAVGTRLGRARVAAIGPVTAETARACGLRVDVTAEEYTIDGLLASLVQVGGAERTVA